MIKEILVSLMTLFVGIPILVYMLIRRRKYAKALSTILNSVYTFLLMLYVLIEFGTLVFFKSLVTYFIVSASVTVFISMSGDNTLEKTVSEAQINRHLVMASFKDQYLLNEDGASGVWKILVNHVRWIADNS